MEKLPRGWAAAEGAAASVGQRKGRNQDGERSAVHRSAFRSCAAAWAPARSGRRPRSRGAARPVPPPRRLGRDPGVQAERGVAGAEAQRAPSEGKPGARPARAGQRPAERVRRAHARRRAPRAGRARTARAGEPKSASKRTASASGAVAAARKSAAGRGPRRARHRPRRRCRARARPGPAGRAWRSAAARAAARRRRAAAPPRAPPAVSARASPTMPAG